MWRNGTILSATILSLLVTSGAAGQKRQATSKAPANLIYQQVTYNLQVPDVEKELSGLLSKSPQFKAYFQQLTDKSVVLMVPTRQLPRLQETVEAIGDVMSKTVDTENLARPLAAAEARLKSRKELLQQYFAVLSKSRNAQDIVKAQNALNRMTQDIEKTAGRVKYLRHKAKYSRLTVNFGLKGKSTINRNFSSNFQWLNSVSLNQVIANTHNLR